MCNMCTGSYTPSADSNMVTCNRWFITHVYKSSNRHKKCDVITLIKFPCVFPCGSKAIQSPYPQLKIGNKSQQVLHHAQVCLKDHLQNYH